MAQWYFSKIQKEQPPAPPAGTYAIYYLLRMSKLSTPLSASLDALPNAIVAASILPFITSTDWLNFRLQSRKFYEIVHGHDVGAALQGFGHDVGATQQQNEDEESKALWCLALVRDYRFEQQKGDEEDDGCRPLMYQTMRCNPDPDDEINPFLSTSNVFTASTAFISWKHWRKIDICLHHDEHGQQFDVSPSAQLVGPYFLRAAFLWRKIEQFCSDESLTGDLGPMIQSTLHPGVRFGRSLVEEGYQDGKLSAFKAVYSFYAGQSLGDRDGMVLPGLFGGYNVYDHLSHSCWSSPEVLTGSKVVVTKDVNDLKLTVFDVESGDLGIYFRSTRSRTPGTKAVRYGNSDDQILRWFENHANLLQKYSVGRLTPGGFKSILRYPSLNDPTNCSRAVTRGVEVVASSIYAVEIGGMFVFSIRMRMLRPEEPDYMSPEERGFDTCQLVSRYWRITHGGEVEEVRGAGVVGYYPLLREGDHESLVSDDGGRTFHEEDSGEGIREKYFSYQSCTDGEEGSMEGYLQFKAGSILGGAGEVFDVRVAPFPLKFPQCCQY